MSTVYRATDEALGRTVAVKILLPGLVDEDPTYSIRFEREARAAAALAHSSVVTVFDTGVDAGSHYIVMEYVAGRSLDDILRNGRQLELDEALRITCCIADALDVAHARGILHRDVKPANVMVAQDGGVKVLDFGIARTLGGTTITQAGSVLGTAAYMAPERALGQPGDERADIYALGCLLYAMLTGRPPFTGEISAAVLHQQINSQPRPPSERRPGLPHGLDALVLSMLAKSPEARPATAAEVRDRITRLAAASEPSAATAMTATMRPSRLAHHRRRGLIVALLAGAVALLAVALLSLGGPSNRATSSRQAQTRAHPAAKPVTSPAAAPTPPHKKPKPPAPKPPHSGPGAPPGHSGKPPGHPDTHPGHGGPHGGG